MKLAIVALIAGMFVFASAIELVLSRHASRKLFVELQTLRDTRHELNQEWGQLLLEQATWATHVRVEELAHGKLGMISPGAHQQVEIR